MLYLFYGSDREKVRSALGEALEKRAKKKEVLRITDAHTVADLAASLQGPGMFGTQRAIVFDSIVGGANEEMRGMLLQALESLKKSPELFFMAEASLDAATRKQIEKFAEESEKFDAPKKEKDNSIFALANALQRGDKKALWVGLMQEYAKDAAPEAVHGLLFWGAKQMLLKARAQEKAHAQALVAALAELPHEARRRGEDLEYALERFVLSLSIPRA
jgi:hypothetical protein